MSEAIKVESIPPENKTPMFDFWFFENAISGIDLVHSSIDFNN